MFTLQVNIFIDINVAWIYNVFTLEVNMRVTYANKKIEKICTDSGTAIRKYGMNVAVKIKERVRQLEAAGSIEELVDNNIGRCHRLTGDRAGQYAMDLGHPMRLILVKENDLIITVMIIEIVDYH